MKKLMILVLMMTLVTVTTKNLRAADNKKVVGEWKFAAPTAPYGYEKGTIVFTEKDGSLAGEVKMTDGYKIELKKIVYKENTLTFGLYVDYEYVSITAKLEGKKMTGTAFSSEDDIKLTAEKVK